MRKISGQKNCTEVFAKCIKFDLLPAQLDVWRKIVFFIFTRLEFQNWQSNRMIILENLNWLTQLGTNLNPILDYSSVYIKWKKGLIQGCVKSVNRSGHVFETFLLTKNTYEPVVSSFICTMYYIIPVTLLFIKKERIRDNVIQKLCLFVRTRRTRLLKYNCYCCFSTSYTRLYWDSLKG